MGNVNCSCAYSGKHKKYKKSAGTGGNGYLKPSEADDIVRSSRYNGKVMHLESPVRGETEHVYEAEDNSSFDGDVNDQIQKRTEKNAEECMSIARSGSISDPGLAKPEVLVYPMLKRSCSSVILINKVEAPKQLARSRLAMLVTDKVKAPKQLAHSYLAQMLINKVKAPKRLERSYSPVMLIDKIKASKQLERSCSAKVLIDKVKAPKQLARLCSAKILIDNVKPPKQWVHSCSAKILIDKVKAPKQLARSCSDVILINKVKAPKRLRTQSFEQIHRLTEMMKVEILTDQPGSPVSVRSHCSADKVMLKKHSSSQILPSRSRKLWWKLLMWSHRNLNRAKFSQAGPELASNQQGGYSSDTVETSKSMELNTMDSSGLVAGESPRIGYHKNGNYRWNGSQGKSGLWLQNQWVALPADSSPLTRVGQWVQELQVEPLLQAEEYSNQDGNTLPSPDDTEKAEGRSPTHLAQHSFFNLPDEILRANDVIQSLNSSSSVAHIAATGLKVIPAISHFSGLRSVNLSSNSIVHISSGSLPKGLHVLNLSRNKIYSTEGLRELTRLRILDLSYNRISRIGQGLSNCTLIKELYLGGNKISEVEGLHRLLKLTILDLSFNKIATTKALGQIVANYNSLLTLNLVGNPIQKNISEDQLRKTICNLLTKLAFLNKQPINPQKAREVSRETTLKAAMGNRSRSARKKLLKRVRSQVILSSSSVLTNTAHIAYKSKLGSKSQRQSSLKKSSPLASSYYEKPKEILEV